MITSPRSQPLRNPTAHTLVGSTAPAASPTSPTPATTATTTTNSSPQPNAHVTGGAPGSSTTTTGPSTSVGARGVAAGVATVPGGIAKLVDRKAFEAFAKRDDVPGAANVLAMKFLITDVDTKHPKVWFVDSNKNDFHYYFARDSLGVTLDLATFNSQTYFTDKRKFIAGTIVAHDGYTDQNGDKGAYAVEFWPTDPVHAKHVNLAFDAVAKAMPFAGTKLAYHPAGDTQEELRKSESRSLARYGVPVISTEKLFEGVNFSPLNQETSFGMLRVVDPAVPSTTPFSPRDIVLFKGSTPNDLTHVAGIITEVPQTPLSHINLKAKQDKVPNAYIKDALQDPNIKNLVGKLVKYEVTGQGYRITAATAAEVAAYDKKVRPTSPQVPKPDLSVKTIKAFKDLSVKDAKAFGGKTTNLAEMRHILAPAQMPDGFGIPFSFYDDFMKANGLYDKALKMQADPKFQSDVAFRDEQLKDFRKELKKAPVPAALQVQLDKVEADMLAKLPPGSGLRLRSSTNNEDLDGFNGAGLYDSYTVRPKDKETVGVEIKKVWASMWNFRAFEERDFWKIPHDKAMMAVTVHGNVDGELANGVAITKNIYDENWPGFYVNSQVGENLVTNPDPKSRPEEMLVSAIGEHGEYETQRIRKSSELGGKPVLTAAQVKELVSGLEKIQAHFKKVLHKENDKGFAMDVEWKVLPTGHIYIKQARPVV